MAEEQQIEGLPEGATLRPVQPQPAASDASQVEGLPEGATLRPVTPLQRSSPSTPEVSPKAPYAGVKAPAAKPQALPQKDALTQADENGGLPDSDALAVKAVRGVRGLYHGAMGDEETAASKGQTTTASPEAASLGFTPEHIGYKAGEMLHGVGKFGKEAVQDIGTTPVVIPDKGDKASFADPKAHTLVAKYVTAPSMAERQASQDEMQKYFETKGPAAAGHAISAFLHGTLGEYVPVVGPLAMSLEDQAQKGDLGGALAQLASLYAVEKGTGAVKEGIKDRINAKVSELTKTPEVKQAEANVEATREPLEIAQQKHDAAMAEHNKYSASHAQGIDSPKPVKAALEKAQAELDEAQAHHDLAKEHLEKNKAAQPTIPQQVGGAAGRAAGKVLPTSAPEVPTENVEAAPVLAKLGEKAPAKPALAPINVKTPGQVQPETFPQEPKPAPRPSYGRITLPNEQGTMGTPKLLAEGTPEGPQIPKGGLPKINLLEEKPAVATKPTTDEAALRALSTNGKGEVVETPEKKIGRLLQEALKPEAKKEAPTPEAKAPEAPTEKRGGERRVAEETLPEGQEERRQNERRVLQGMNERAFTEGHTGQGGEKPIDTDAYAKAMEQARKELGPDASVKDVMRRRDEIVNPEAKGKTGDVGTQSRETNPEPTRAEAKVKPVLPKEEPTGYAAKKEEVVPAGAEGREPVKSAAEYHPAVEQKINELSDDNLKKLAKAHGLNPDEYDFKARDERRHRTERDQLAKDITEQIGEDEKINLGRAAESAEKEPGFANRDQSAKGRADRAAKLFPRLRGPVDEYGNPKVSGGAPTSEDEGKKNLWHGTTAKFENFELQPGAHLGFHFSENKTTAGQFGKVKNYTVDLGRSLRAPDVGNWGDPYTIAQSLGKGIFPEGWERASFDKLSALQERYEDGKSNPVDTRKMYALQDSLMDKVRDRIKSKGYDSVVYNNEHEGGGDSYIVVDPDRINNPKVSGGAPDEKDTKLHSLYKQMADVQAEAKTGGLYDLVGKLSPLMEEAKKTAGGYYQLEDWTKKNLPPEPTKATGYSQKADKRYPATVGTAEGAKSDTEHFANAKKELGANASISDVAKRAQELKDAAKGTSFSQQRKADEAAYKKADLKRVVSDYNDKEGLGPVKDNKLEVDPRSKEIARAYDDMKHDPSNPEVKKSYAALIDDAKKQWDALKKAGIKLEPQDEDPYKSYDEMKKDFDDNKRLKVFRGGNPLPEDHPLAQVDPKTGETYNVMFRGVHDAIGHLLHNNDFSEKGEENAYDTHRQTMSKEAIPAMTTETKGQVSAFFNGGNEFPDQKAGLLPDKFTGFNAKGSPVDEFGNPTISGGAPEKKLPTGDALIKKYGESNGDPKDLTFILKDGRGVANTGIEHDHMLGGRTDEKVPPRERFIAEGNIRVRPRQGAGGREVAMSIPESGVTSDQLKYIQKMSPQLRSGAVMIEVGKPGGAYKAIPYGEASPEQLETVIRGLGPVLNDKGSPIDWNGNPTVSGGAPDAGTAKAKEAKETPKDLEAKLPDLAQQHLSPEEKASLTTTATGKARTAGTQKFIQNMEKIPTVQEYTDIAQQGEGARKWYSRSTAAFDAMHEEAPEYFKEGDKEKFMGVLAGSSPQQSVAMNLREALGFWKEWNDAGRPKFDLDKWKEFGDAARKGWEEDGSPRSRGMANGASMHWDYAPTGPKWKAENLLLKNLTLPETKVSNIIKALNGEPMWPDLTKNQAFKAPSFAENLKKWIDGKSAGTKHVTNDSWMGLFGGIDKSALSKPENYHPLSVATRAAAEALGWEPEEAQAAIWSFTQALTEKGVEDPEMVRHYSEDFKDLLANDLETRDILKGLGVNLDQLDRKLDAIGEKPKISGRSTPTTAHSVGQLRGRIEDSRGKGAIPEPKSVQGSLFRENSAFEHKANPGAGHTIRDEGTRFEPSELEDEDSGLTKLGEKKKKSPYGSVGR